MDPERNGRPDNWILQFWAMVCFLSFLAGAALCPLVCMAAGGHSGQGKSWVVGVLGFPGMWSARLLEALGCGDDVQIFLGGAIGYGVLSLLGFPVILGLRRWRKGTHARKEMKAPTSSFM